MRRKDAIISILVGLIIGAVLWFTPVNSYFFNIPLIVTDWSHAALFGCEKALRPDGGVDVIYACSLLKERIGMAYALISYYLGWMLMGLGGGYIVSRMTRTRERTKISVKVSLILVVFVVGLIAGRAIDQPVSVNTTNHLVDERNKELVVPSQTDPTNKLILRSLDGTTYNAYIQTKKGEKYIMGILGPREIYWSLDATKVTLVSHISNEEDVHIIDANTGLYVIAGGQKEFVSSQANPSWYTHVYSGVVTWLNDDNLIVSVSGYPDFGSFRPKPQFFLINAASGNVIRRIL